LERISKVFSSKILASLLSVLLLCAFPLTAQAAPTTLTVGPGETYTTIQSAVDAAIDGDIILVEAGTYAENVAIITPNLTIRSIDGAATTIVQGNATFNVFNIDAPGVTIDGFTIAAALASGIYLDDGATTATITDNVIGPQAAATCNYAIYAYNLLGGTLTITGNTISDCEYGVYQYDGFDNGTVLIDDNSFNNCNYAVYLADYMGETSPVTVTVSNNTITDCQYYGIYLYSVYNGTVNIQDNNISNFDSYGINVEDLDQGTLDVSGNNITDGYDGIYLSASYYGDEGPATITVTDNQLVRCSDYGLYFYGLEQGSILVSRNTVIDCPYGLEVEELGEYQDMDAKITYNTVSASGDTPGWDLYAGIYICCPNRTTDVSYNSVSGYEYGIEVEDIGCCGLSPVILSVTNNEASDCDYGYYFGCLPCCLPGTIDILNNTAANNSTYGMYISDIGDYPVDLSILGNVFSGNPIGLYVGSLDESNADVVYLNYNGFVGNTISYTSGDDFSGLDMTANWWARSEGPENINAGDGDLDMVLASESVYTPWVTSLAFDRSTLSLSVARTSQLALIADLSDDTTVEVTDYVIKYTSSNEAVATVSASGLVTAVGKGTAVITADCMGYTPAPSITVTVTAHTSGSSNPTYFTINASASSGGTIAPSGATRIIENRSQMYTIIPNDGYEIGDVLVDGISVGKVAEYTFSQIGSNHTIEAQFVASDSVCGAEKYNDVDTSLWYHEGIDYVISSGLFNGTSDTTFEPNSNMTRAMLVTVLWRLDNEPTSTATNLFADIAAGVWYTDAVVWATENDIVDGYNTDSFGPNDSITREQMAAILYRYTIYKGYDVTAAGDLSVFNDAENTSEWALAAMKWAVGEGLVTGVTETRLDPAGNASRAQVAMILMRYVQNVVK